ncbi:MAG: hypothetical protein VW405_10965 [Rhodospirillaceae bacterium]
MGEPLMAWRDVVFWMGAGVFGGYVLSYPLQLLLRLGDRACGSYRRILRIWAGKLGRGLESGLERATEQAKRDIEKASSAEKTAALRDESGDEWPGTIAVPPKPLPAPRSRRKAVAK